MLESLVVSILNRFLKNYVSNLNYDQLNIGIWQGQVNLRNLKLRKDALDKLHLPINVSEGYLGELTLVIPWSNLRSEPVKVIIDHVYLLAEPKNEATVTVEEEEERAQQLKRRRLETAELVESAQKQNPQEQKETNKGGDGFLSQLTTKIIDNLQFTLKNVHIRYEDKLSDVGHTFAVGITLKELSALSTDDNWSPKFISEPSNSINKLAALESLSVYWNTKTISLAGMPHEEAAKTYTDLIPTPTNLPSEHQYILKPVSGTGRVKLNKAYGGSVPKADVTLLFDEIAFGLDDHQYRDAILMIDLFHSNFKKQKYLKYHPGKDKTPRSNPREYFQFAGKAILAEIHDKNYRWSWDSFKTRRDQRLQYIDCYVADKLKKASKEQSETLAKLEYDLTFEDIRFYRSIAKSKLKREKVLLEKEAEKKKAEAAKAGWWGWLRGTNTSDSSTGNGDSDDNESIQMTEEQKKELYAAIEYEEDKADIASAVDVPKDTIKFAIKAKLQRGSFTLKQNVKEASETDLISIVFDAVSVDVTQYLQAMKVEAALGDLQLFDGATKDTIYYQLIGVRKKKNNQTISLLDVESSKKEDKDLIDFSEKSDTDPFFAIVFEKNPLDGKADNAFSLKMKHLEIIYSPLVIEGVMKFFKPPESQTESVNALIAVAGDTFEGLKLQTRAGLQYAIDTHTTIDLNIDMDAPIIIIPESLTSQESPVVIIDAGHINIDSQLADKKILHDIKSKDITTYNEEDIKLLESLMYDKFNLQLTQTKFLIGHNTKDCLWQLQNDKPVGGVDARLIERIDMNFLIEMCILPGKSEFTKIKVSGHLPLLSVNLSDKKYKILMKIIDFVIPKTDDDSAKTNLPARPSALEKERRSTSNLLTERFWGSTDNALLYDSASDTTSITSQSNTSTAVMPQFRSIDSYEAEQFKLEFKVDKVSAVVYESATSANVSDTLLCELVLSKFTLTVITRPDDLLVDVSLKSLGVIDKIDPVEGFDYLITSDIMERHHIASRENDKNLVNVKYQKASRTHPQFKFLYDEYDQTVDVALSTLSVIVNRKSILRIYNWIMNTFTAPPNAAANKVEDTKDSNDDKYSIHSKDLEFLDSQSNQTANNDSRMKVSIHMDSINLILNQEGLRLGTVELSVGDLIIKLEPNTIEVNGKFGDLTLSDDTVGSNSGTVEALNSPASETFIISIVGDELADFTYKTYDPQSSNYPNYNQEFILRMGAIHLLLTDSVKPTLSFLQEFLEMKAVYDAARNAAVETAQQYQENMNRFHFDILIKSPVLTLPLGEDKESEKIIANLGEIRAENNFITMDLRDKNNLLEQRLVPAAQIKCGLYDISLRSLSKVLNESHQLVEYTLPIIDDLDISFDIKSPEDPKDTSSPGSQIEGNISDIRMSLTERQYKSLLEAWNFIQQTFLTAESTENDKTSNDEPNAYGKIEPGSSRASTMSSTSNQVSTEVAESPVKVNLDLIIHLHMVCLEIISGDNFNEAEKNMLSKLKFDGIGLKLQNMSDGSMQMEVVMNSINFADARAQSKSNFREIIPANKLDGPQIQFKLLSYKSGDTPIMDMKVTVDSPKVILSLDYLLLLKDFFMTPFVVVEPTEAQRYAQAYGQSNDKKQTDAKHMQRQGQAPATVMKFTAIVVDLKVLCLADPENKASEAVILSFNELIVNQDTALDVKLNRIGMVLCRMDNMEESTMHFVEEFSASLTMETASNNSVHNLTIIKLHMEAIIFRLSYQDAMLITTIANKAVELMGTNNASTAPAPNTSDTESETDSISSHILDSDDEDMHHLHMQNQPAKVISADKPRTIEPFIVMSKESLTASFDGIQIVLIEDMHDLPYMDVHINPFSIHASDWSRAAQADVEFSLKVNYFNFKNSHWEPIVEPWSFGIAMSQDSTDKSTNISVQAKELLFVNLSHTFVESLLSISDTLSERKLLAQTAQAQVKPYLIRNFTGYNLRFWNMSDDVEKSDGSIYKLKNGETMPWTFRDWKKRREKVNLGKNMFGVQIEECGWENLTHIPVDRESQRTYRLRPEYKGISHRLVVDIHLENNIKTVTFRSGLIVENRSSQTMQVAMIHSDRRFASEIVELQPYEIYNVPILLAYNRWLVMRPSDKYHWSKQKINWADMLIPSTPKCIECLPWENTGENLMQYNYQLNVEVDKKNPISKQYPFMKIQICPPVEVENLLPFGFDLTLTDEVTGNKTHSFVERGKTAHLNHMKSNSTIVIQLDLRSDRYKCSNTTVISTEPNYSVVGEKIVITDQNGVPLVLRMNISRSTSASDSLLITIYAPYLIINKTGLPISLRHKQTYRQGRIPVEQIAAYKSGEVIEPVIFSYPEIDHRNRAQISINESKWSDPISFEAVGNTQDIMLLSKTDNFARHAGIRVNEGVGILRLTKIVTITPRFILKNNMNVKLKFCEFGDPEATDIDPGQKMPLYHTSKSHVKWLCLQLQHLENNWSAPFNIQEIGKTFVKVDKGDGTIPYLVRVSVHIKESTIFITFNEDNEWPYYIVNKSGITVHFKQENIRFEEYDLKEKQKKAFQEPRLFTLAPGERLKYSWDIPVAKEKRLELHAGERRRAINFQAIGAQIPFRYKKHRDGPISNSTLSIDIVADDSALVLRLMDFDLEKSLYRPKSSATSTLASSSREGSLRDAFETINVQHIINYTFELNLAGIGLSVINKDAQEIAFATVRGLNFKYTDSNMYQSVRFSVQWLQIDNQLYGSTYPILCYPTTLPKVSSELSAHPTLHLALDKVKDDKHGVLYFKLFSILLQEMTFEMDEDLFKEILDFIQFENAAKNTTDVSDTYVMAIEEPVLDKAQALYYFEEFCIQPMRLNLSFVKTDSTDDNPSNAESRSAVGYIFNVFTMTLGNINDAPIKLNALIVDNLRASSEDLTTRIMLHYREQIVYQIHRVLGSIDILGNPVGLFNTLSSGFGELFYEPYQGFIMSDRPQDLGIGIAKGVGGFVKKGVFGISDSMSRFTGSLGKGISAATMDKKFQDRRRMNMTRNKPTHAIYGVTQGVGYFGTSIASGFAGLVKRPLEGAESGGVSGFVEGVGRGVVGVFTKPVVGFLDMASNITAGIRETTTVFEAGDLGRERLPRYTGKDGIITPYSQREALGQMWLNEADSGKYANEIYIAHSLVNNDKMVAILTETKILVIRSDYLKLETSISLNTIQEVKVLNRGVVLTLKKEQSYTLAIEEETSRKWFAKTIDETIHQTREELARQ